MVGMKLTDPHKIVTALLTHYVYRKLSRPMGDKTSEALAQTLAGARIAARYRVDIPEGERNLMAREFLRGVLSDQAV